MRMKSDLWARCLISMPVFVCVGGMTWFILTFGRLRMLLVSWSPCSVALEMASGEASVCMYIVSGWK